MAAAEHGVSKNVGDVEPGQSARSASHETDSVNPSAREFTVPLLPDNHGGESGDDSGCRLSTVFDESVLQGSGDSEGKLESNNDKMEVGDHKAKSSAEDDMAKSSANNPDVEQDAGNQGQAATSPRDQAVEGDEDKSNEKTEKGQKGEEKTDNTEERGTASDHAVEKATENDEF